MSLPKDRKPQPPTATKRPSTPEEASPSLLWAMYTQAPVPHELVEMPVSDKFPAKEALPPIAIVPISIEDQMLCQVEADDYANQLFEQTKKGTLKSDDKTLAYGPIFDKEATLRVLWRACRDSTDPKLEKRVFPGPKAMRLKLTPDQISVLAKNYVRAERLLSPIRAEMTIGEMNQLIDKLREGGSGFPLDWLSSEQLSALIWHLISLLPGSPTPSGSPGSQPEDQSSPIEASEETPEMQGEEGVPTLADAEPTINEGPDEPTPHVVTG